MKTAKIVLFSVFAIVLTVSLGLAASHHGYKAMLTGKDIVPPVETQATGEATFTLSKDGKELTYTLTVKDIENATAAHIHAGKKGENGGPLAGLFAGPKKEGMFSGELAKGTITDKDLKGPLAGKKVKDLVKIIKDGGAYVNIHTEKNPNGEIRGQIM
jgi:CHRD domain